MAAEPGGARRPAGPRRLPRLWRLYATLDLLLVARGWREALTFYLSDLVVGIGAATAAFLLAERFDGLGGWSRPAVVFLLGYGLLVGGVINAAFNFNVAFISRRIGRGQLDHLLVQPQPLWVSLLSEGFAPFTGSGLLLVAAPALAWSVPRAGLPVGPGWLLLGALDLVGSVAVVLAFSYVWGSLAFWAPRAAEEINTSTRALLDGLWPFPLDGLGGAARRGLLTGVPVGFVAWYPCRALLAGDPVAAAATPLAALAFGAVAALVFRRGLRHYARVGSSRYLSIGHRR